MSVSVTSVRRFFKRNNAKRFAIAAPVFFYTRVRMQARTRVRVATTLVLGIAVVSGMAANFARPAQTVAATSNAINFQARLETAAGAIVPDGNYNVEFKLYSVSSGGTALWTEDYLNSATQGIQVANGYLTANLGSHTSFPGTINWDQQLWLTMNIGGTTTGVVTWDGEMNPRLQLTALPYAFRAGQLADPANSGSALNWLTQSGAHTLSLPNESGTLCSTGSVCSGYAASSGSGSYIQNGTSPQSASFNVTGTGTIGTSLTTPSITSTAGLSIQGGTTLTLQSTTTSAVTLDSGTTGQVNIGTGGNSKTIQIGNTANAVSQIINIGNNGTAGSASTVTIGSATSSNSTVTLQAGTTAGNGSIQIGSLANGITQTINIGTNTNATQTVTVGSKAATSSTTAIQGGSGSTAITLSTAASGTIQIGNTTGANTQTINIGNNGTASSTTNVLVGSTIAGTTTIQNAATVALNAPAIDSNATTLALFASPTTINLGAAAATFNIGPGGATAASINLAGGSGASGCTVDGATGNLACTGTVTGSNITTSLWSRVSTTLQPATAGDNISTSGNILTTGSGVFNTAASYQIGGATVLQAPGTRNTFVGNTQNTAVSGSDNTAVGSGALKNDGTGFSNTAVGSGALGTNTSGSNNSAFGIDALRYNGTGAGNTVIGSEAGGAGVGSTANINGSSILGANAGNLLQAGGDYNTLVGYGAGANITTGAHNIIIGDNLNAASGTTSYQLSIGNVINGSISAGQIAVGTSAVAANGVLTVGTNTTASTGGIYFGNDTNLYRAGNNLLQTDDALTVLSTLTGNNGIWGVRSTSTNSALLATVTGDAFARYQVLASGTTLWGSGAASADTQLIRTGAGSLAVRPTSGNDSTTAFQVQNAAGTNILSIDTSDAQTTANGSLVVFAGSAVSGGGANGGSGTGASGDMGGGGGGGIGGGAPVLNACGVDGGYDGGQAVDVSGLFAVVSALSFPTTGPGASYGCSDPGNDTANGGSATGFGSGGGGAGWWGGTGGNGLYGGGGAGAAGHTTTPVKVGGNGGQGVVVISPTGGTNVVKTSGTSYTVPAGVTQLKIWTVGAGGGGAGASTADGTSGGGGGAGGVAYRTFAVTPGQVINYSLGAAGSGGSGAANGNAGGNTTATVGSVVLTATGGAAGRYQNASSNAGGTYSNTNNVVPFQVQDAAGNTLLSADTTNSQVSVAGNLNATTYSVNGTPGASITCATGTSLQGATVVSGIVTIGSCVGASYARIYNSADQSIANGVMTTAAWNSESQDTDNYHDNTTNNSRLTAPSAGFYHITANMLWAPNATGTRYAQIVLNNTTTIAIDRRTTDYDGAASLSVDYYLNAGDYIVLQVFQGSGGALAFTGANSDFSIFKTSAANGGGGGGTLSVGTLDSQTKSSNGAVISSNNLYLQTADASNPGLVSTSTQTFAGDKTFNGLITGSSGANLNGAVNVNATGSGASIVGNTSSGGTVTVATSGSNALTLNAGGSSNTGIIAKTVNSSTAAFQVQNTAGASVLNVDTVNTTVTVTGTNSTGSQTFNYSGSAQTFTVPAGVTSINVTLYGAGGGSGGQGNTPTTGGQTTGTMSVTPGQVLTIYAGGAGSNGTATGTGGAGGFNGGGAGGNAYSSSYPGGGGGGGASMIKNGATVLAAAGGGGGGAGFGSGSTAVGGPGGGTNGGAGTGRSGGVGTQSAGGIGYGSGSSSYCGTPATNGSAGQGGAGGIGIGGPFSGASGSGGGGGGYYGGGGGDCGTGTGNGGGGGGSGYTGSLTGASTTTGGNSGNGQVILSFVAPALQVGDSSGNTYFSVNPNAGSTLVKGTSTTAFQVQNTAGTTLLTADTTNQRINVVGDVNVGVRFGNRLFSDDFESGSLNFWDQGTGGTITDQTSIVHDGKYAAQTNFTSGTGYASATIANSNTAYARAWVYVATQTTDGALLNLQTTTGQSFIISRLNTGGTLDFWDGVANTHTSGGTLSTGAWHLIEMQVTIGASTGTSQVWVDGTQVVNLGSQNNGTNQLKTIKIGDSTGGHTMNAYYDDVAADVTSTGTASSLNVDDSFHVGGTSSFGNSVSIAQSSNILFGTNAQIGENSSTNLVVAETSGGVYVQSHILQFQDNYNNYANEFTIQNAGQATFQNATNSNTAFQVQNASGAAVLLVDTTSTDATGATVNYLKYPGFEAGSFSNAAAGWAPVAPGTLAQNNNKTNTYNGLYSAQLVTTASNGGITTSSFNSAPAGSASYIVSFYAKVSTGTMSSGSFTVTTTGGAGTCTGTGPTINSSGFQRVYCTVAAGAGTITALSIAQNDGTARTIYIDGVQMQSTTFNGGAITAPTPYDIGGIMLRGVVQNPLILQPNSDSTSIFQVNNAAGTTTFLNVDTTNSAVTVGGSSSASATTIQSGSNGVTINANSGAVTLQTTTSGAINIKPAGTSNVVIGTIDNTGTLLVLDTDADATILTGNGATAVTNGPSEVDGALFYSSTSKTFICGQNGVWMSCMGGLRSANTAVSTAVTATSDTNFTGGTNNSYSVPANDCQTGRVYKITSYGTYTNSTTATTATLKVKFGATTIGTSPAFTLTTSSTHQWSFDGQVTCIDSTHIEAQGKWVWFTAAGTATTAELLNTATIAQVVGNAQTITLSAAVSQTTGAPSVIQRQFVITGLGP